MTLIHKQGFIRNVGMLERGVTVHRKDDNTDGDYATSPTYTELGNPRSILVTGFDESMQTTGAGERQRMVMVAYSRPDVDLQTDDRIEYGGQTGNQSFYEVTAKFGRPDDADPVLWRYELEKVDSI